MAWIAAGAALLGGIGNNQQHSKDQKTNQATEFGMQELRNTGLLQNTQLNAEEGYYYSQLNKQEKMRGLDEFRKFSTVKDFAPTYANTNPNPITVPDKPIIPTQGSPLSAAPPSSKGHHMFMGGLIPGLLGGKF